MTDGMVESGCGAGCFSLRASRVALFISLYLYNFTIYLLYISGV